MGFHAEASFSLRARACLQDGERVGTKPLSWPMSDFVLPRLLLLTLLLLVVVLLSALLLLLLLPFLLGTGHCQHYRGAGTLSRGPCSLISATLLLVLYASKLSCLLKKPG